ncbi:unnamed protein product [Polarella glacialis]|uniref:Peptidase C54 catalytic domain-containing protein n=1 Tax=Polarella glacialis TaxID=89957 RepID=A0A813GRN8_POLGL|nr:unnamed protein product [Polarella glacialis]
MGGRPRMAHFFVGRQGQELLYVDPHVVQPAAVSGAEQPAESGHGSGRAGATRAGFPSGTRAGAETFRNLPTVQTIPVEHIDSSISFAFYCSCEEQLSELIRALKHVEAVEADALIRVEPTRPAALRQAQAASALASFCTLCDRALALQLLSFGSSRFSLADSTGELAFCLKANRHPVQFSPRDVEGVGHLAWGLMAWGLDVASNPEMFNFTCRDQCILSPILRLYANEPYVHGLLFFFSWPVAGLGQGYQSGYQSVGAPPIPWAAPTVGFHPQQPPQLARQYPYANGNMGQAAPSAILGQNLAVQPQHYAGASMAPVTSRANACHASISVPESSFQAEVARRTAAEDRVKELEALVARLRGRVAALEGQKCAKGVGSRRPTQVAAVRRDRVEAEEPEEPEEDAIDNAIRMSQFENFCKATAGCAGKRSSLHERRAVQASAGAYMSGACIVGALIQLEKMQQAVLKVIASQQPMMTNMKIDNVEFWAPLNTVELLQAIVQNKAQMLAMELVYTSQIKERLQEVYTMMEEIKTHAAVVSHMHGEPVLFRALFVPPAAMKRLTEARSNGEQLVIATVKEMEAMVKAAMDKKLEEKSSGGQEYGVLKNGGEGPIPQLELVRKGVLGGETSNRKKAGAVGARLEEGAATKMDMVKYMKAAAVRIGDAKEFKKRMCVEYGKKWRSLKKVLEGEDTWITRVDTLKLGKGTHGSNAAVGSDQWRSPGAKKVLALTGARRPGGGRKDSFLHIKLRVKSWLEKERSMCHHVDKADLVEEFLDQCRDESEAAEKEQAKRQVPEEKMEDKEEDQGKKGASREALLQQLVEGSNEVSVAAGYEDMKSPEEAVASLSPGELKVWDTLLKDRVTKLKSSSKYFESFGDRLVEQIGAKVLKPGRMSTLSMDEEEARVKAGWKDFDAAMWLAAFSPEAELEKWVANPGDFMERRHECFLGFSDQIPVWIKIGMKKQVYCSKEVGKRKTTGDFMKMQKKKLRADLMQKKISGKEVEKNEEEAKEDKKNEDEKEIEDEKENGDEKKNEDESGVPDLVFSDDEGEEMSKEKLKSRTKPAGVGDSGLKRTIGDAAQEKFRITVEHRAVVCGYFDPAVEVPVGINWRYALVVKGVHASKWKEGERYQYGGKLIERKAGKCVGMILKSWVQMRKRKPELFENWEVYSQPGAVVDPIIPSWELEEQSEEFPCSVWCRDMLASGYTVECRMKQSVAQQIPCQVKAGVTPIVQLTDTDFGFSFKASLAAAHVEMRQEMKAKAQEVRLKRSDWIVAALRRNGYFHWRPCWKQDCLVEASLQDWCQELPEGSYRYPSHWLDERGSWLKEGVPKMSALKDLEDAVTRAKDAEEYFCRSEGFLFRVASMKRLKLEEHHGALKLDDDEKLEMPAVDDKKEQDQEKLQMEKLKKKHTMHVLMQKSKEKFRVMMQTMTRKEAIQSLLTAGGKKKKTKVQKQQKQMMKSNVKGKFMTKVKASLKKDPSSVEKKPCAKKKPSLKNKPSVKNKPCAKTKPSLKNKPSVKNKPSAMQKNNNKNRKKAMQKGEGAYGGGKWKQLKKMWKNSEKGKRTKLLNLWLEKQQQKMLKEQGILKEARFGGEGEPEVSLHFNPGAWSCLLKHTVEVEQVKKTRKLKGFNEVSRVMLQSWLWDCGLKLEPEDPGDDVTVSSQGGDWLLDQHLNVGWELLKFGAGLQESAVQYVPPDLLQAWMHLETEGAHPDADEEFLRRLAAVQENRRKVIVQKLDKAAVVLMPVYCSQHWTLVVAQKVGDEVLVEYRDSLQTASEESWQAAAKALKALKGWELPRRCNTAAQPPGSALCGAFALFWMEQVCRKLCLNEPACSMGWPNAALWSARTCTVSKMLKKEQDKQIAEAKALQLKNEAIRQKQKAVDEKNRKKQEQLEKIKGKVEASAKESWLKVPAGKPCLENLSKEGQLDGADKANTGQGSCSRCRWGDVGCLSCSGAKALEYWLKKEGFYDEF